MSLKKPFLARLSKKKTVLPSLVTGRGAACLAEEAMPKGMLFSEKWWA